MAETNIQWCDFTFNPWSGCSKVHAGCTNCYAEVNYSVKMRGVKWGPHGNRVRASDSMWQQPLKWNRQAEKEGVRLKVFCASLADVFEDWHGPILNHDGHELARLFDPLGNRTEYHRRINEHEPPATMDDLRRDLFALINRTPWLDWLLLTKRPENVREMWPKFGFPDAGVPGTLGRMLYLENVWIGTSPCDQKTLDESWPYLARCRDLCSVLFLSLEPLLGPIDLRGECDCLIESQEGCGNHAVNCAATRVLNVDWVIVGGESGPGSRPCNVTWVRSIVGQCRTAGVPCFVKQAGAHVIDHDTTSATNFPEEQCWPEGTRTDFHRVLLKDKKGGDLAELPPDLRVRQWPVALATV